MNNLLEKIFHKNELRRLRAENEDLLEYNKKLSNRLREKHLELKALKKIQKKNG